MSSTGFPPRWASSTTTDSAACMSAQRSSVAWSVSATPFMSERMSKGFLRSALLAGSKISPSVANPSPVVGRAADVAVDRVLARRRRGKRSPGTT